MALCGSLRLDALPLEPPPLDTNPVALFPSDAQDITVKMFYRQCMAAGSYIVAHEGTAVVIDPLRDVEEFEAYLLEKKLRLKAVLCSHAHADYCGGHTELARKFHVPVLYGRRVPMPEELGLSPSADTRVAVLPVHDGDTLWLSDQVCLRAMETPGHTPGCVTWRLEKKKKDIGSLQRPPADIIAAFTGDTLFIGSCGRPDLVAGFGFSQPEMAALLYTSLRRLIKELPPGCVICPAHGAGSPCGKSLSTKLFDSLQNQLGLKPCGNVANLPLQVANSQTEAEFVRFLIGEGGMATAPKYFLRCVQKNVSCDAADVVEERAAVAQLEDAAELRRGQEAGASIIVDLREADDFARCHVEGSLNFALGTHGGDLLGHEDGNFALWIANLVQVEDTDGKQVLLVVERERLEQGLERLARVDLLRFVEGWFDASVPGFWERAQEAGVALGARRRLLPEDMRRETDDNGVPITYLDIRTEAEYQQGTVKGAVNLELTGSIVSAAAKAGLVKGKAAHYVCFCLGGFRSAIASSFLRKEGFQVDDVKYGFVIIKQELPEMCGTPPP